MAAARQSRPARGYRRRSASCWSARASRRRDEEKLPAAAARHLLAGFWLDAVVVFGKDAAPPRQRVRRLVFVKVDDKDVAGRAAGQDAHVGRWQYSPRRRTSARTWRREPILPEAISSRQAPGASSSGVRMAGARARPASRQRDTSRPSHLARPNQAQKIQLAPLASKFLSSMLRVVTLRTQQKRRGWPVKTQPACR
jgi:hypothetical protein